MSSNIALPSSLSPATKNSSASEIAFLLNPAKPGNENNAAPPPPMPPRIVPLPESFGTARPPHVPSSAEGYVVILGADENAVVSGVRWVPAGAPPPRLSDFEDSLMPAVMQIMHRIFVEHPHASVNGMDISGFKQMQVLQARAEAGTLTPSQMEFYLEGRQQLLDYFMNPPANAAASTEATGNARAALGPLVAPTTPEPAPELDVAAARRLLTQIRQSIEYQPPEPVEMPSFGERHEIIGPSFEEREEESFDLNDWPRAGSTELPLTRRPYTPYPDIPDPQERPAPIEASSVGYEPPGDYEPWTGLETPTEMAALRPEEMRERARKFIEELRDRSRRTGESFGGLLADALHRFQNEDPVFAIYLRTSPEVKYNQINGPAGGGTPSEHAETEQAAGDEFDDLLSQLERPEMQRARFEARMEVILDAEEYPPGLEVFEAGYKAREILKLISEMEISDPDGTLLKTIEAAARERLSGDALNRFLQVFFGRIFDVE